MSWLFCFLKRFVFCLAATALFNFGQAATSFIENPLTFTTSKGIRFPKSSLSVWE
jgi:hypothetical protein